jgi:glutaredoxin 3
MIVEPKLNFNAGLGTKAKEHGLRSVPAVVIDGKLAGCFTGRGPDEYTLRSALA